ncbi:phytase [Brevundimonas sp. NIBR11]|uniref:phytase n=1 Tax=Brevundimonas sp. NIBR11 TaxID=3015999 RepID=UPI0022F1243A|nr:phytase [Brevundimonas sp. NIBR11]WGM32822.1 3-phytase [Brevundimonas sp. NIBR11]
MTRPISTLAAVSLAALLLSACATHEVDYQGEGEGVIGAGVRVQATLETPSVGTGGGEDAADDPAVWIGERPVVVMGTSTPGFVAGTDKKAGLYIYGFDGAVLQFMPEGLLNNVDAADLMVSGRSQVVLGASDRTPGKEGVSLYLFDPAVTGQNGVRPWGAIRTDVVEPYGFCFGRRGEEVHAILVGHEGEVRQFVLSADAAGQPVSREVRRFEIGSISEGCAADAGTDALYLAEENVGVWRYGLNPVSGEARTLIQPIEEDVLVADAEGLTILADGAARYLIGSSQGDSAFPVWRIDSGVPEYKGRFVVEDGVVDGVTGTDGLAAMGGRVSDAFPEGVVVVQDDVNDVGTQNFKFIDWRVIKAALGL